MRPFLLGNNMASFCNHRTSTGFSWMKATQTMFRKFSSAETRVKQKMDLASPDLMICSKRPLRTLFVSLKVVEPTQIY